MICRRDEFDSITFKIDRIVAVETAKRKQRMQDSFAICKFWLAGKPCKDKEQDKCAFRHARGEKTVVCKHWLRGLCKKSEDCEFLHVYDMAKMPPCHFYNTFGQCSNPDCLFLHLNLIDQVKECPWYARGFCKHGTKCRSKHVRKKGCLSYILGFCIDGPKCPLGHPKYELPTTSATNLFRSRRPLRPISQVTCFKCGNKGHYANTCNQQKVAGKDNVGGAEYAARSANVTCFKCGQVGHYANKCPTSTVFRTLASKLAGQNAIAGSINSFNNKVNSQQAPSNQSGANGGQGQTYNRPFIPGTFSLPLN